MDMTDARARDMTTRQWISQCKIKYEIMTCNGKAISKVMGWGMILNMIRDKNGTQEWGRDGNMRDRPRTLGILMV
jgi:hypothetical protein